MHKFVCRNEIDQKLHPIKVKRTASFKYKFELPIVLKVECRLITTFTISLKAFT